MRIVVEELMAGARRAEGLTVIIDVLRASATACHILEKQPRCLELIEDIELALERKKQDPGLVLVGELEGLRIEGFDYCNSPSEIEKSRLKDMRVIFRTSSGIAGIEAAEKADETLLAGFVNIEATARYIEDKSPGKVTLVAMGWSGRKRADEDMICAEYLKKRLEGRKTDAKNAIKKAIEGNGAEKFRKDKRFPPEDLELSLEIDRFDYALKAERTDARLFIRKERK